MKRKTIGNLFSQLFYGWRMVGLVSAIRVLGGGLHSYGFTVFFLPLSQDLGLSRAATSLAFSLARAEGAIEAPLAGYLIDRFGPRPIILASVLMAGTGYMVLSWVESYPAFLAVYLGVISLSFTAGFVHSPMVLANTWFIRLRARAMTMISAAVPIGGALISPLLALGVHAWGWRWAAFAGGCAFLLLGIPLGLRVRRSPESIGLLPDGDVPLGAPASDAKAGRSPGRHQEADVTAADAMRTPAFWMLTLAMLARVGAYSTVIVHFVPLMVWKGMTEARAALLLAVFAFTNLLTHFLVGWIADRSNKPRLLALCMLAPAASVPLLLWTDAEWSLWLFTVVFTVVDSSFPVTWAAVGDFFGRRYFATIRGTMAFFYMWGSVLGPVIAGAVYDRTESYAEMLWGLCGVLVIASLLCALLIRPWVEAREKLLAVSS